MTCCPDGDDSPSPYVRDHCSICTVGTGADTNKHEKGVLVPRNKYSFFHVHIHSNLQSYLHYQHSNIQFLEESDDVEETSLPTGVKTKAGGHDHQVMSVDRCS